MRIEVFDIGRVIRESDRDKSLDELREEEAIIEVYPKFQDALFKIGDEKYLWIVWYAHLGRRDVLKIHRYGKNEEPIYGVFCLRGPHRPNPIMISLVRLLRMRGRYLHVKGLDAYSNTPILDIKPYSRSLDDPRFIP